MGAVHQLGGAQASVRAHGRPNAQKDQGEMVYPVRARSSGTQPLLNHPVNPLDHPITLGMVHGGAEGRDPQQRVEFRPKGGHELTALVSRDVHRNTETTDPVADQSLGAGDSSHVDEGNGFEPPGGAIQNGEEI